MKGMKFFGFAIIVVLFLTIIVFVLTFISPFSAIIDADKMQTIAAILAMSFGTAVAFSGSLATLKVANITTNIADRQGRIDATKYLEDRFTAATRNYTAILNVMGSLYASVIILEEKIYEIEDKYKDKMEDPDFEVKLAKLLVQESDFFCDNLKELIALIKNLMQDNFCIKTFMYNFSLYKEESWLDKIHSDLLSYGMKSRSIDIAIDNLSDCLALLEMAERRLNKKTLEIIKPSWKISDLYNGNSAIRSFFFLGNLISFVSDDLDDGSTFFACYGASIFRDLIKFIPDGEVIKKSMEDVYPSLSFAIPYLKGNFDPSSLISKSLLYAISDSEKKNRPYLLVFSKK